MNKEWKAKWLKALRGGKYRQGRDQLRVPQGAYCCLGVLRAVMQPGSRQSEDGDGYYLSESHKSMAGLTVKQEGKLATLNDSGKTFEQIADYIDKRL